MELDNLKDSLLTVHRDNVDTHVISCIIFLDEHPKEKPIEQDNTTVKANAASDRVVTAVDFTLDSSPHVGIKVSSSIIISVVCILCLRRSRAF